jgi:hypothetical protein
VAEKTFASETAQIETEFAAEAVQLRDAMLAALTEQRQALVDEKERLVALQQTTATAASEQAEAATEQAAAATSTGRVKRSMRSAAAGAKRDEIVLKGPLGAGGPALTPLPNAAPKRRAAAPYGSSILGVSTLLPEHEIYDDLNAISRGGGGDDGGAGRRNAPRTQAQKAADRPATATRKRPTAAEDGPLAVSSPAKPAVKRSMKDLSAPADESLSADDHTGAEDDDSASTRTSRSARRKSVSVGDEPPSQTIIDGSQHKRKNSAEDKYISIEPSGVFYYCGCKHTKGASFDMAFGRDLSKSFPVILLSAAGQEIQVKKVSDGSKIKISLDDLVSGSVMILASQE